MRTVTRKQTPAVDVAQAARMPAGRDSTTGKFIEGNTGARVGLLDMEADDVAPWLRPAYVRNQRRFRAVLFGGLLKRTAGKLTALVRAACTADAFAEGLAALAFAEKDVKESRALMADSRTYAKEARTKWLRIFSLVGLRRGRDDAAPLSALARELNSDSTGTDDGGDDE